MEENKLNGQISDESVAPSDTKEEETETPEYVPTGKYEKVLYSLYKNETYYEMLKVTSYAIAAITVYAFFMMLMGCFEEARYLDIAKILAVTGVPFIIVSVIRHLINAPRPYELLPFYEKKPKHKSGRSFPSRHVFSIFVIGTVLLIDSPILGAGILVLGVLLAALRVLLGLHFIRDVIAGAAIGAVSGIIGILIISFT